VPAAPKVASTQKQVSDARSATFACAGRDWVPTSAKKIGSAANGSTIEKMEPNAKSACVSSAGMRAGNV